MKNSIYKTLKHAGVAAALALLPLGAVNAAPTVGLKASLDSAYILMGKQTAISIESVVPSDKVGQAELLVPDDTLVTNVEVVRTLLADSVSNGATTTLRHQIIIQSFDSGLYTIPPVKMAIGHDTALSNHLILKVIPIPVDSLQGKIHDYAGVADPGRNFFDFIPQEVVNWLKYIVIALLILAAAGGAYYYLLKRRRSSVKGHAAVVVPPYDEAIAALNQLKAENLCEHGHEREFYTRLTDILRHYLDRRFGISAMEMTSTEILRSLSENNETRLTRRQMQEVLSMADFVKFAKVRPLPDDNIKTLRSAFEFVENTKPAPVETPDEKSQTLKEKAEK